LQNDFCFSIDSNKIQPRKAVTSKDNNTWITYPETIRFFSNWKEYEIINLLIVDFT